jgi:hypothetical protein
MSTQIELARRWIGPVSVGALQLVQDTEEKFVSVNDPQDAEKIPISANLLWGESTLINTTITSGDFELVTPPWVLDWIKFNELAEKWKDTRSGWRSFSGDLMRDPSYSQIVGMGPVVVPFILYELQKELIEGKLNDWFYALWAVTQENPLPPEAQGKPREAAKAWIEWGRRQGYVHALLGSIVPTPR